jgi:diguanylate cyclase (GGDEF)-like protein
VSRTPDETYAALVNRALPRVAAALAALSLAMAATNLFTLDGADRVAMVALAGATATLLAVLSVVGHRRPLTDRLAEPVICAMALVFVLNAVTCMVLREEPRQTTTVMLAVTGAGAGLLSLRWLVGTLYGSWGLWVIGALLVGPRDSWPHFAMGMVSATTLAMVLNQARRRMIAELADARAEAEAAAVRDHLTGLANRRGLAMVGGQIVEHARRQGDAVHCIFVDVDGLKRVNDKAGHAAGDAVLMAVAESLRSVTRSTDVVARWGGDEFCVVGPGPGMAPLELERRIRDAVLRHPPVPESAWAPRISAGGAMLAPWDSGTLETLLGKADQEMYLRRSLRREGQSPSPRAATAE